MAELPRLVTGPAAHRLDAGATTLTDDGVPADVATSVAAAEFALGALPATELAARHGVDAVAVARIGFVVAERLELDRLLQHIAALPRGDRWQTEARAALRDEFHDSHEGLTAAVLTVSDGNPREQLAAAAEHGFGQPGDMRGRDDPRVSD